MKKLFFLFLISFSISFADQKKDLKIKRNLVSKVLQKRTVTECCTTVGKRALEYTNTFRAENGLPPLEHNPQMVALACAHSYNMAVGNVPFGHQGLANRASRFGFPVIAYGENVYYLYGAGNVARKAIDAFINSPGHRANLLGNYNQCGIGVYQNEQGYWYLTQEFALK